MPETTTLSWVKDIFLLTFLIGFLYCLFLDSRPLTPPDEGRYSEIPREMVASGDYITPRLNGVKYFEKPVLFYWLQSLSIKTFGLHEWSLRLMTSLMGLFGCLLTYAGARVLYDRPTALLSSLIIGTSLLYAVLSDFITLDMTLSTFLSASLLCFLVGNQYPPGNKRRNYMWLMYLFAGLATLTKGLIGILFPGMIILSWLLITQNWRSLPSYCLLSGAFLFLAITLPWHIWVQLKNPEFFHFYFIEQHFLRYLTDYANRSKPKWFLPLVLSIGFFPWTGFLISAFKQQWQALRKPRAKSNELFLFLWAALIFLFYWCSKSQLSPYILPIFTPLAILTASYCTERWHQTYRLRFGFNFALVVSSLLSAGTLIYIHLIKHEPLIIFDLISLLPLFFALATFYHRRDNNQLALALLMSGAIFILTLAAPSYELFDTHSIKPLAVELRDIIQPADKIYNFNHYYQDLPVYLKHNIKIVNWTGELAFGSQHEDKKDVFIKENDLIKEWSNPERKFLIAKKNDIDYLKNNLNLKFILIDAKKDIALICNQEIRK